jgi:tetratricopeptide (TPR) repeat protein
VAFGRRIDAACQRGTGSAAGGALRSEVDMRRFPARVTGSAVAALCLGLPAFSACGGGTPAKSPTASLEDAGPYVPPVHNDQGQQVGMALPVGDDNLTGDAKSAYQRGFQAWMSGDLQAAKVAFRDAASRAPAAGGPRYSLGCVLERLGDTQGALDAYRAAFSANSKYEVAMGAYALLQAQTGHGVDAEQFLNTKGAQSSTRLTTYLAEVKSIEGDSPGCQQLAQQALTKQPDFKDAMVVIARDYYRNHRWDLANYALKAILDGADDGSIPPRDQGNASALLLRGLIEREMGQRQQALTDFQQAVAKRPDLFEAYVDLGEMKLEAGNATEALTPLERAVKYAPNVAIAHLDLGDCYRLLGRPGDAKSQFDQAAGMDSTLAGVHYDLGLLYLFSSNVPGVSGQEDQLAKAIKELETFKAMRGAKGAKGPGDDVDELLSTAKRKQSELQMKKQAAAQASAAPAASPAAPSPPTAAAPPAGKRGGPAPASSAAAPAGSSRGGDIVRDLPK